MLVCHSCFRKVQSAEVMLFSPKLSRQSTIITIIVPFGSLVPTVCHLPQAKRSFGCDNGLNLSLSPKTELYNSQLSEKFVLQSR